MLFRLCLILSIVNLVSSKCNYVNWTTTNQIVSPDVCFWSSLYKQYINFKCYDAHSSQLTIYGKSADCSGPGEPSVLFSAYCSGEPCHFVRTINCETTPAPEAALPIDICYQDIHMYQCCEDKKSIQWRIYDQPQCSGKLIGLYHLNSTCLQPPGFPRTVKVSQINCANTNLVTNCNTTLVPTRTPYPTPPNPTPTPKPTPKPTHVTTTRTVATTTSTGSHTTSSGSSTTSTGPHTTPSSGSSTTTTGSTSTGTTSTGTTTTSTGTTSTGTTSTGTTSTGTTSTGTTSTGSTTPSTSTTSTIHPTPPTPPTIHYPTVSPTLTPTLSPTLSPTNSPTTPSSSHAKFKTLPTIIGVACGVVFVLLLGLCYMCYSRKQAKSRDVGDNWRAYEHLRGDDGGQTVNPGQLGTRT